uniref:Uncharacterized protein n=1 Tax=uncultured bacterium A1Q1_fos_485 TaxID=1256576 RepID=L7W2E2_9BACT|nr:hypothetical protein [uncultured bacterium A1Q1_fos_485]
MFEQMPSVAMLVDLLRNRRSRRFAPGMQIPSGPLTYASPHAPNPLTEAEEAALAFAACGVTGYALADLAYGPGHGGQMLAGLLGRTVASPDAINTVAVVVTNDEATYLLKRPQDFAPTEFAQLVELARAGELTELYRRSRVKIKAGRAAPPVQPGYNFNINRWSLYAPGSTYFLPINEITALYLNAVLEAFDESMGLFLVDERNHFQPAGIGCFGRSKGGHLADDLAAGRGGTIQAIELSLAEAAAVEQGMVLQNIALMAQALGLGGFPNFARHEWGWFAALGFRMGAMPASRYLGAPKWAGLLMRLLGKEIALPIVQGLEQAGQVLLKPFCPPYYPTMTAAVEAFIAYKFGAQGVFRGGAVNSAWRDAQQVAQGIPAPSEQAIAATIAYCEYIYNRYGRFPAYSAPFRTVLGYQATHVDIDFYDKFYHPEALSESQRARWQASLV